MNKINSPKLWLDHFPQPLDDGHKYDRGHAVILAAPELTGATRLAAEACSRVGAGLVSVVSTQKADIFRQSLLPDIMVRQSFADINKPTILLAGSGGIDNDMRRLALQQAKLMPVVLDADMLDEKLDFSALNEESVLTPHCGEFARLFPELTLPDIDDDQDGDIDEIASQAAQISGAIIVLKGPQTIIAHPDGRRVTNTHTSPYLAKAGTGDVLGGMIAGLIAQNMPPFHAACTAVWLHGEAARRIGAGLVASDIQWMLRTVLPDIVKRIP